MSGTVAALSVLFAKSSAEIIKESIKGRNQFTNFFSYVLIAMLLACLVLQMKWLNVGLTKADALFVIPVYQVFWVVMNVVTGMIYFEDYLSMNWTAMFFFILGIIITLFGVYFLTQRSAAVQEGQQQIEASFGAAFAFAFGWLSISSSPCGCPRFLHRTRVFSTSFFLLQTFVFRTRILI